MPKKESSLEMDVLNSGIRLTGARDKMIKETEKKLDELLTLLNGNSSNLEKSRVAAELSHEHRILAELLSTKG